MSDPVSLAALAGNDYGVPAPTEPLFGVEIEVEGVNDRFVRGRIAVTNGWSVKQDGSLRNGGAEFVSAAQNLASTIASIRYFYSLRTAYAFVSSIRTSTHVHADVRLYDTEQLRSLVTSVCLLEPLLMAACGPQREQNIYCVPFYRANDDLERVHKFLENPPHNLYSLNRTCKYSALYLEPIRRFGTVEFRQAPVWDTPEDAIAWLTVIANIIAYSVTTPAATLLSNFQNMGASRFLLEAVGVPRYWLLEKAGHTLMSLDALLEEWDVMRQATMLSNPKCGRKAQAWDKPNSVTHGARISSAAIQLIRNRRRDQPASEPEPMILDDVDVPRVETIGDPNARLVRNAHIQTAAVADGTQEFRWTNQPNWDGIFGGRIPPPTPPPTTATDVEATPAPAPDQEERRPRTLQDYLNEQSELARHINPQAPRPTATLNRNQYSRRRR